MKTMTEFRNAVEAAPIVPVLTVHNADHAEPLAEALGELAHDAQRVAAVTERSRRTCFSSG